MFYCGERNDFDTYITLLTSSGDDKDQGVDVFDDDFS